MSGHPCPLYAALRTRGWFCGPEQSPTHLLLDGGKLHVPDDAAGEFLNVYATSLVRDARCRRPCIVEVRTPLFRMFFDLDARAPVAGFWSAAALECLGAAIVATARECFVSTVAGEGFRVTLCGAPAKALDGGLYKVGLHVHLPDVVVTSATALAFRAKLLDRLVEGVAGLAGLADSWDKTVDGAVYTSSGLRMAWSGKGASDDRHYAPLGTYADGEGFVASDAVVPAVSAYREWVRCLSIRAPDGVETPLKPEMEARVALVGDRAAVSVRGVSMAAYDSDILKMLDDALPPVFMGQRFSGIVATSSSFLLRSTARYCYNLDPPRGHHNNNVYFVLTRSGISQRCYCRCETIEGRRGVTCRDFTSATWPVPQEAIDAFFGAEPLAVPPSLPGKRCGVDINTLVARAESRKKKKKPAAKPKAAASRP